MRQQRENTERFVRQRSGMRLDPPADRQRSDGPGEPPVIWLGAGGKVAHSGSRGEMPHMEPVVGD